MGYLQRVDSDVITMPSNRQFWVKLRKRPEYRNWMHAANIQSSGMAQARLVPPPLDPLDEEGVRAAAKERDAIVARTADAYCTACFEALALEWNLTDEDDKPLPLSSQVLGLLNPEDGATIVDACIKRMELRKEAAERPFGKRSGARSAASKSKTRRRSSSTSSSPAP